jgi:uncharacterized membrane protein
MQIWVVLKLVHILSVITAVGANLTYQFWYARAGQEPAQLVWVIESVRRLDRRVANPAYVVAALAGVGIVVTGPYTFQQPWIALAIVIYIVVAAMGMMVYAPAIRRQLELAGTAPASDDYRAAARRSRMLGMIATGLVLVIVCLMVFQPTFQGS